MPPARARPIDVNDPGSWRAGDPPVDVNRLSEQAPPRDGSPGDGSAATGRGDIALVLTSVVASPLVLGALGAAASSSARDVRLHGLGEHLSIGASVVGTVASLLVLSLHLWLMVRAAEPPGRAAVTRSAVVLGAVVGVVGFSAAVDLIAFAIVGVVVLAALAPAAIACAVVGLPALAGLLRRGRLSPRVVKLALTAGWLSALVFIPFAGGLTTLLLNDLR